MQLSAHWRGAVGGAGTAAPLDSPGSGCIKGGGGMVSLGIVLVVLAVAAVVGVTRQRRQNAWIAQRGQELSKRPSPAPRRGGDSL
jgi:uncharacterized membrane protein